MRKKIYVIILMIIMFVNINVLAEGEATLKNIRVNGRDCVCNGYECNIEVDASSATITFELNDSEATVNRLSGFTSELTSQNTTIKIIVTNDKGAEKIENTYNINITAHEKSSDYSLQSLKVNGKVIELIEDTYVYSYDAGYTEDKIKIEAVPTDAKAKMKMAEEYEFALDASSTTADFEVTAENNETRSYRIVIKRATKPDTTLKSISLNKGDISFKKEIFEYDLKVEYSVNELEIEAIPNSSKAKVEIDKKDLVVGENDIKIKVTNESEHSEYILHVTREENMDKSIANLKSLLVYEYPKLNFEENVLDYVLKFNKIPKKLTINANPINNKAKVEVLNNENLENNSKIIIRVSLEEPLITREYSLRVTEENVEEENKTFVIISIIGVVIAILVMFILEIKDKKIKRRIKLTKILELKKKKDKEKAKEKTKVKKEKVEVKKEEEIEII